MLINVFTNKFTTLNKISVVGAADDRKTNFILLFCKIIHCLAWGKAQKEMASQFVRAR